MADLKADLFGSYACVRNEYTVLLSASQISLAELDNSAANRK